MKGTRPREARSTVGANQAREPAGNSAQGWNRREWEVMVDASRSFKFVVEDPKWVAKVAIGGLVNFGYLLLYVGVSVALALLGLGAVGGLVASLIAAPFLILSLGYAIQVTRSAIAGTPSSSTLPEWSSFESIARDGVKVWAIHFLLFLPVLVASAIAGVLSNSASAGPLAIALALYCLVTLWGLGAALLYPVAMGEYAATNDVRRALHPPTLIRRFTRHAGTYLLVLLLEFVAGLIAAMGLIACGVGFLFTAFYASLVIFHLIGAAYRTTYDRDYGGAPSQVTPAGASSTFRY